MDEQENDGLVEVRFEKVCHFTDDAGGFHVYKPGTRRVPRSHAENWFVKYHLENPPPDMQPVPGSPQHAEVLAQIAREQKERAQLDEQQQRQLAAARAQAEYEEALRRNSGSITVAAKAALNAQVASDNKAAEAAKIETHSPASVLPQTVEVAEQDAAPPPPAQPNEATPKPKKRVRI